MTSALFFQSGGTLTTNEVRLTGVEGGAFYQTDGIHNTTSIRLTGASGASRYELTGGSLNVSDFVMLGSGSSAVAPNRFAQYGGTANIDNLRIGNGGEGAYSLTDTPARFTAPVLTVSTLTVGQDAKASFVQSGARSSVTAATLVVGDKGAGRYAMTTGALSAENVTVGSSAQGALVLDGGTQSFSRLTLGAQTSGAGVWQVDSGTANVGSLVVGSGGRGEVLQSGGTVSVTGTLSVASKSRFVLSGDAGLINPNAIVNRGSFEHHGGIFAGILVNDGIYLADHLIQGQTIRGGRLINRGQAVLLSSTSFNDGLRNEAVMNVLTSGLTLTLEGAGLANAGSFTINGGTLQGSGRQSNSGSFSGHGRIGGTGGAFTNSGSVRQEGGTLMLANSVGAINSGRWTLLAQQELQLERSAGVFDNQGKLELSEGRITGGGLFSNAAAGIVMGSGSIATRFTNHGTLALGAADRVSVSGAFSNLGLIDLASASAALSGTTLANGGLVAGRGRIANAIDNQAAGRIQAEGGVLVLAGKLQNQGLLAVESGGTLLLQMPMLSQGGTLQLNGGTFDTGGFDLRNDGVIGGQGTLRGTVIDNAGRMQFSAGSSQVGGSVNNLAGGLIVVSGTGVATFNGTVQALAGSELRVSQGSAAVFFGSVAQRNGAAFTGIGTSYFEGGLSIGDSPGLGGTSGSVVFGDRNLYRAEIGGLVAGSGYDKFVVGGALGFGGTLQVSWWGGFEAEAGQRFDLFDWGSASGHFAAIDFSAAALDEGLRWDTSQLYSTGEISVAAVPEPSTWALMLIGMAAVSAGARRSPQNA